MPTLRAEGREVNPERTVRHQPPALEFWPEEGFAVGDALRLTRRFQAGPAPGILRALHDESAGARIERIGMDLEQAVVVAAKDERKRVEREVAPKPHVFRRMHGDLRLEELLVRPSHQAIDAVRADDQIGALELRDTVDLSLELQPNAERAAAPLEDVQQDLARDAGEDVAAGTDLRVPGIDVVRIPASDGLPDLGEGLVVGIPQG